MRDYEQNILNRLGIKYEGLEWCELGNQTYYNAYTFTRVSRQNIMPAKKMYVAKGVNHTSIDINGRSGAIKLNLDYPVPVCLINKFDVVTDYGTIEHIANQYSAFSNVHYMCKKNGIMLHVVPAIGNWKGHCSYYYSEQFFISLAKLCKYTLIDSTLFNTGFTKYPRNLVVSVLKKVDSLDFISKKVFFNISGVVNTDNISKTGNYSDKGKG